MMFAQNFLDPTMYFLKSDGFQIAHHSGQVEWNALKHNEERVREKIEEYLEIYNQSGAAGLPLEMSQSAKRKLAAKKKLERKRRHSDSDVDDNEKEQMPLIEKEMAESDEGQVQTKGQMQTKSKNQPAAVTPPAPQLKGTITILPDGRRERSNRVRAPAQELVNCELKTINEQIVSLVQIKNMGLSTADTKKQLKKLFDERKKKSMELKRLRAQQITKANFRKKRKMIVEQLCEKNPEVAKELNKVYRTNTSRPSAEEQCPDLLKIIEEIARCGGATDNNRQSEQYRPCATLDDLRETIKQRGYDIRQTTSYYRLLPRRAASIDGRRHVRTVPVRLRHAVQINDPVIPHEDSHFATATIRYIKDLASIFGNEVVFYISQNEKCKVPIGLPAAKIQAPMLMHLDYDVKQPNFNSRIAPRYQLIPSVYAACIINPDGELGYAGPTYIAVRSAKHDRPDAQTHLKDFDTLVKLKEFEKACRDIHGNVKPIVIITVDGGPDDNPRFPKTLMAAIAKFRRYNLDALFVLTQAPGQVTFNVVERRMSPLAQDLGGLILPHDYFGTHLDDRGVTINEELEKLSFQRAGEVLAEVWRGSVLDEYPVMAEYIASTGKTDDERREFGVTLAMESLMERAEEGEDVETRANTSEEDYLEKCHVKTAQIKEELTNESAKYELDEYWCGTHVLQTQYTIQIVRCNDPLCCGKWRSNYVQIFPHRFLPPPVPFERTPLGIVMANETTKTQFYGSLFHRIQFHGVVIQNTLNDQLPFDYCCTSVKKDLKKRVCKICKQYIPSIYRMKQHYKIHEEYQQYLEEEEQVDEDDLFELLAQSEIISKQGSQTEQGAVVFSDMLDWLKSDFEELDLQEQAKERSKKSSASWEKGSVIAKPTDTWSDQILSNLTLKEDNGQEENKKRQPTSQQDEQEEQEGEEELDDWEQVDALLTENKI
ncbi:unnamed protein product [Didymodactylos carnosus]|uniref:C2H2-type domain-containing protein n=1 Tax=Didymodactylos carnosus TaxID=1234261 RepID=A0A814RWF7_9BILA|nr:unnamed protein product [Didymodactylos carnosus]CAF1138341.1 unnamed protein product [Didymodactylos carnosus]CAF3752006.1 unnamed protein product [Didymodactylos carnosus]CAF3902092.1 unnamed protein product [Didymodactylos carnosus]